MLEIVVAALRILLLLNGAGAGGGGGAGGGRGEAGEGYLVFVPVLALGPTGGGWIVVEETEIREEGHDDDLSALYTLLGKRRAYDRERLQGSIEGEEANVQWFPQTGVREI